MDRKDGTVIIKVHEALLFTGDILRIAKCVAENGVNSNHEAWQSGRFFQVLPDLGCKLYNRRKKKWEQLKFRQQKC